MARILAAQGQLEKARGIYRFLMHQEPGRKDLAAELDELNRMQVKNKKQVRSLAPLYDQWLRLVFEYHQQYCSIVNKNSGRKAGKNSGPGTGPCACP